MRVSAYQGRFAPSPTGALHAGSLVAALASWLDARAHGGTWAVRIEDVDTPRCVPGAGQTLLAQLAACGLHPDGAVLWQSQRSALYQQALEALVAAGCAYPCACTRRDIQNALTRQGLAHTRHTELIYPGTCRHGLQGRPARAWRLHTGIFESKPDHPSVKWSLSAIDSGASDANLSATGGRTGALICWQDRRLGRRQQDVAAEVGDFVLRRADGLWAYQLAVVVDDAAQGITDIVRGEDLADNTPRQILLQRALGLPPPRYLHTPLVRGADGDKLSKQHGAPAIDTTRPLDALNAAALVLGLPAQAGPPAQALAAWVGHWRDRWVDRSRATASAPL
jgi:glutamyl-Q tRNA(Asp) synthetase